jgi:hypothetical protein
MANELNIALPTSGLTVTAQRYQAGAAAGSAISLSEVGSSGFYSGNMTGSAGAYEIAFIASSTNVGSGSIVWSGAAEVPVSTLTTSDIPTESDIATEVWDTPTSGLTTSGAIGTRLKNSSTVATTGSQLAAALS